MPIPQRRRRSTCPRFYFCTNLKTNIYKLLKQFDYEQNYVKEPANIFMLVFMSIVFLSCSKDDDKKGGESEEKFSLVGTTYAAYAYHAKLLEEYDAYYVYRFTSSTDCEKQVRKNSPTGAFIGDIEKCTYVLSYPKITIVGENSVTTGSFIDINTFRTGSGSYLMEFVKQ